MGASSVHEEAIGSTTNIRVVLETDSTIESESLCQTCLRFPNALCVPSCPFNHLQPADVPVIDSPDSSDLFIYLFFFCRPKLMLMIVDSEPGHLSLVYI